LLSARIRWIESIKVLGALCRYRLRLRIPFNLGKQFLGDIVEHHAECGLVARFDFITHTPPLVARNSLPPYSFNPVTHGLSVLEAALICQSMSCLCLNSITWRQYGGALTVWPEEVPQAAGTRVADRSI
jgi:hypothetical protein